VGKSIDAYLLRLQNWQETCYQEALKNPSPQREKMRKIKQQRRSSCARLVCIRIRASMGLAVIFFRFLLRIES